MNVRENDQQAPSGTVVYTSELLGRRHPGLLRQLEKVLRRAGVGLVRLQNTRDIWVRDFMPIQRHDGVLVSYTYNPDYLRCGYRELITDWKTVMPLHSPQIVDCGLLLDGGNVVLHDRTAIVTDKVFTENPQFSRRQVESRLRNAFGLEKLVIIPVETGDIFGHADGVVAWIGPDRVLINDYRKIDREFHRLLSRILNRAGIDVTKLPYAPDLTSREFPSATGNYTNLLVLPGLVVIPAYGLPQDETAFRQITEMFADLEVVSVDAASVANEGGSIHCLTW